MAITRTPWVDDDGTGTTGTVINNAEKTALYDQMDAAFTPLPIVGTFTITDGSGAGIVIGNATGCTYIKIGRLVQFWIQPVWPATANTANVIISGFPFVVAGGNPVGGAYQCLGPLPMMGLMPTGGSYINLYGANGGALRNVDISGQNFILMGQFLTAS